MLINKDETLSFKDMKELLELIVRNCAVNVDMSTNDFSMINSYSLRMIEIIDKNI